MYDFTFESSFKEFETQNLKKSNHKKDFDTSGDDIRPYFLLEI